MLNTQSLFDDMVSEFGVLGGSKQFTGAFFRALKRVKSDMESRSFVEFDVPDNLETNIDLDSKYYGVIYSGLMKYINSGPEWGIVPKGDLDSEYAMNLRMAQAYYFEDNPPSVYYESE